MTSRVFLIPALTAALLIGVVSCKHSEEVTASEAVESVVNNAASENFTLTLDDGSTMTEEGMQAAPGSTAEKSVFSKIKERFRSSRKESADSLTTSDTSAEDLQEKVRDNNPKKGLQAERQKTRKEKQSKETETITDEPIEGKLDTLESGSVWTSISPMDLTMNPVKNFAKDWMALVVGRNGKEYNSMTIAWGTIGQLWNKPIVIVFVSEDRYTKQLLDASSTFSVIGFPDKKKYRDALLYIGSHSQRDEPDKTENAGFTIERTKNGTPIIAEGNLAIECRKLYEDAFDIEKVPSDVRNGMYQKTGIHHMYIGEIVSVLQKN